MTDYISAKTIPQAVIIFYNIHVDRNRRFTTIITRREERNSSFTNDPPPSIMYIEKNHFFIVNSQLLIARHVTIMITHAQLM